MLTLFCIFYFLDVVTNQAVSIITIDLFPIDCSFITFIGENNTSVVLSFIETLLL